MFHFALIDDGHCFEPSMRMDANAPRRVTRLKPLRSGIIKMQEGADMFALGHMGKHGADREPVPDPMRRCAAVNAKNLSHHCLLSALLFAKGRW